MRSAFSSEGEGCLLYHIWLTPVEVLANETVIVSNAFHVCLWENIMELTEGSADIKGHSCVSNMDSVWCCIFRLTVVKAFVTSSRVTAWRNLSNCIYQSLSTSYPKNKKWVLRSDDWFIYYHSILHAHIIYRAHTQVSSAKNEIQ